MSVFPNTFIEPFDTSVKDIWSVPTSAAVDEIHKDLYMKLSMQAEEIAALTNLCQTLKAEAEEANSLKAEIAALKRVQVEMKAEMSSLLSGDFYIHAGGSPHGKISGGACTSGVSILSQDHMINCFTAYDVAADGTVKCLKSYGRDDSYPLTQRWSFERATDKLIRDGTLKSIPI